ncbi:PAS domain-containing protein [Sphingomonas sp. LY54]|uniref:LuxR C-terminal-related transcriptional regulator n=1 Tax=Sphingomonas sp. LY54 TaxID=3095343 RepID=UPI002D76C50E|nr:PAS domain-containing protein [Sphingomonas sp. LY54]WRP27870.1 PAS domain-containing protein [Sphingomonas sp. LY54]
MGTNEQILESIGVSPIATVITNPRRSDNPVEVANAAFCALTGYPEQEIVGRNCRFLAGAGTEPWITERIREAVRARHSVLVDILNYRRDGTPFRNGVLVTPMFDGEGDLAWFLGSQVDLGADSEPQFAARRARAFSLVKSLPARRRQVLELMARGLLNKQIAWELKLSEKTVKMHRRLLLEQLGVPTSTDAIRIAVEAGL